MPNDALPATLLRNARERLADAERRADVPEADRAELCALVARLERYAAEPKAGTP